MSAEKRKTTTEDRIAANLKAIRADNGGLSQEKVAAAMTEAGYSWHQATVYKVEQGERQVQLGEASALAQIFGVSLNDLIGDEGVATAAVRLSAYARQVVAARLELQAAHTKWVEAQQRLADVLDVDPWGDKGSYRSAWSNLPDYTQRVFRQEATQSVTEALEAPPF